MLIALFFIRPCSPKLTSSDHVPVIDREQKNQLLIRFLLFPSGLQDSVCATRGGPHSVCYGSSQIGYARGPHNEDF